MDADSTHNTSLKYLQMKDAFRRTMILGVDVINEESFCQLFQTTHPKYVQQFWLIYVEVIQQLLAKAMTQFDMVCKEVGLESQLEQLETLILQRGLAVDTPRSTDASTASAFEASARMAAKYAEKEQLEQLLSKLQQQQQGLSQQLEHRKQSGQDAKENLSAIGAQVAEVYKAGKASSNLPVMPA
eukprot:jgi/Chrzof1/9307/UNPLg00275.t1